MPEHQTQQIVARNHADRFPVPDCGEAMEPALQHLFQDGFEGVNFREGDDIAAHDFVHRPAAAADS
jgi:hypothetical protein